MRSHSHFPSFTAWGRESQLLTLGILASGLQIPSSIIVGLLSVTVVSNMNAPLKLPNTVEFMMHIRLHYPISNPYYDKENYLSPLDVERLRP